MEVIDTDPAARDNDLRHTGNTFAAASGARLRDLMPRMGHDSERAAMIYQDEARGADQAITRAIDSHVQAEQRSDEHNEVLSCAQRMKHAPALPHAISIAEPGRRMEV